MKSTSIAALTLLSLSLSSCGILYTDIRAPRAYRTSAPSEVKAAPDDPLVTGQSCSRSAAYLVAWGDMSYAAAARDALKAHPDGILYDVRADVKVTSYALGLYTRVCTLLTGKVAKE